MKVAYHFLCPDSGRYIFGELRHIFKCILAERRMLHAKIRLGDVLVYNSGDKDKIFNTFIGMLSDVGHGWSKVANSEKEWKESAAHFLDKVFGKNFFAITFEPLNESEALFIHNMFLDVENYVGAFEVNPNSKIHWYLYIECMGEKFRLKDKKLFLLWSGFSEEDKSFHAPEEWGEIDFESIEFEHIEYETSSPPQNTSNHKDSYSEPITHDSNFHALFHPFLREASLIEGILHVGLTSLRASSLSHYGNYYVAFFNLSIGIERICKFSIILDFMIKNNLSSPPYREIKRYSHGLTTLHSKLIEISNQYGVESELYIEENSIEHDILLFLDKFAQTTRYQNINELCNIPQNDDHLSEWKDILDRIVNEELPESIKVKTTNEAAALYDIVKDMSYIMHFGHDKKLIPQNKVFLVAQLEEKAKARAVRRVINIISPLCELTWTIWGYAREKNVEHDSSTMIFPEMNEFFREIVPYPGQRVLNKKRWKNY